jgi:hypothetical protein
MQVQRTTTDSTYASARNRGTRNGGQYLSIYVRSAEGVLQDGRSKLLISICTVLQIGKDIVSYDTSGHRENRRAEAATEQQQTK